MESALLNAASEAPAAELEPRPKPPRERMLRSMLVSCGERGFARIAVRHVLERAGVCRQSFYNNWENKEGCFFEAYSAEAEALRDRILAAADGRTSWRDGVRAGLIELLSYVIADPWAARALFLEAQAAGPRTLAKRSEILDELALALDRTSDGPVGGAPRAGTEESSDARDRAPSDTARFVAGGVDSVISSRLASGKALSIWNLLPELMHFVVLPYFGPQAALAELGTAPLAITPGSERELASAAPSRPTLRAV